MRLRELSTREQVAALGAGRLDVGFLRFTGQKLAGLEVEVLFRERYVAALPAEHVLSGRGRIALGRLVREPLIMPPSGDLPVLRAAMDEAFSRVGGDPETVQEARSKFTVMMTPLNSVAFQWAAHEWNGVRSFVAVWTNAGDVSFRHCGV